MSPVATTQTAHPDFAAVVGLARLAPSVHNTQPWLFHAAEDVLTLRRDLARRLPALDPAGRQQTISCGAALYLARLGLRLQRFDSVVESPTSTRDGFLAQLRAAPGRPVTAEEIVLEHAGRSRHTQRGVFQNRPVAQDVVAAMRDAAQEQGAWVRMLRAPTDQVALAVLVARAEEAEISDPSYRDELATWTNRPSGTRDGVPGAAIPDLRHRASTLKLRDFSPADEPGSDEPVDVEALPLSPEHVLAMVLGTVGDGVSDWLLAGQALAAMLLRAGIDGVQASPLGQVVDQPWSRRRQASEIGCVGHPQMVPRVGHAFPGPATPRRPVGDVLT
jgi:nitroreductase